MRSWKKQKNNRILIALAKGIAGNLTTELAMLFCHAGFDVFTALFDDAEGWVAPKAITSLTGHTPMTCSNQPAWTNSRHGFDQTILVNPTTSVINELESGITSNPITEYILKKSPTGVLLLEKDTFKSYSPECDRFDSMQIPDDPMKLHVFFQHLFAQQIKYLNGKKKLGKISFLINYDLPEMLKETFSEKPLWLTTLEQALLTTGFKRSENKSVADIVIDAYDGPQMTCKDASDKEFAFTCNKINNPTEARILKVDFIANQIDANSFESNISKSHLFIKRTGKSLELYDLHGARVFPNFDNHCCFKRLADYLATSATVFENKVQS